MSRRKPSRPKRQNNTRHRRTVADPKVQACIDDFRLDWDDLDRIEKGQRFRELIDQGCSTRGLGDALGISATCVRRYMTLAALPEKAKDAVREGYSAKRILKFKERKDRERERQERIALDAKTGEFSDRLANTILAFCKTVDGVPPIQIGEEYLVKFLSEVRNESWRLESLGFLPPKLLKRHNLKKRFRLTRPPVTSDVPVVHLIEWLAVLLLAEEPERQIWEEAITKAGRRANEFRPKDTRSLVKKYLDEANRKKEISASPPRRRF